MIEYASSGHHQRINILFDYWIFSKYSRNCKEIAQFIGRLGIHSVYSACISVISFQSSMVELRPPVSVAVRFLYMLFDWLSKIPKIHDPPSNKVYSAVPRF